MNVTACVLTFHVSLCMFQEKLIPTGFIKYDIGNDKIVRDSNGLCKRVKPGTVSAAGPLYIVPLFVHCALFVLFVFHSVYIFMPFHSVHIFILFHSTRRG